MKNVLIVGATSVIAQEVARCFAKKNATLFLVGRNSEKTHQVAQDLLIRGAKEVRVFSFELVDLDEQKKFLTELEKDRAQLDAALIAYGSLPSQEDCEKDPQEMVRAFHVNSVSVLSWVTLLANRFQKQKSGVLAVISSVAADRGRKSNYVYGSTKASLDVFLEGLRARLKPAGVSVLTVKPGWVATPMTAHLKKSLLIANPKGVGSTICRAILSRKSVIYVPWYWRWIMFTLRQIPRRIFERMSV